MLRLIQAEIYKLFKNKTLRILCIVALLLSTITAIMSSPAIEKAMLNSLSAEEQKIYEQQMAKQNDSNNVFVPGKIGVTFSGSDAVALDIYKSSFGVGQLEILIGILVSAIVAKEYSQGTFKNSLAYGKKRHEVYLAKFVAILVGIIILTISIISIGNIGNIIMNGWGETFQISIIVEMIKTFIIVTIAYASTAAIMMLLATLIKSNGATIGTTIGIFVIVPTIVGFFYGKFTWFDKIFELTPSYNTALVTWTNASNGDLIRSVTTSLITIAIVLLVGIKVFEAQDIK